MRISYEKVPAEMKGDSLHSGKATRAENAVRRRRKDERLEERSIRQRLIAPVITTNSHPLSSEGKRWLYTVLYCVEGPERIPRW